MTTSKNAQKLVKQTQVQLIDNIISIMKKKKLSDTSITSATPHIQMFAEANHLSFEASMIFASFFSRFTDGHIIINDIADFYECNQVKILTYWPAIEELKKRAYIIEGVDREEDTYYSIPQDVTIAVRNNTMYKPKEYTNLNNDQWVTELSSLLRKKSNNKISYTTFLETLHNLIDGNKQLVIARELSTIQDDADLIIIVGIMDLFIQNHDEHIVKSDLEDLFANRWEMRTEARRLEQGIHPTQRAGIIEHSIDEGQVETNAWKLTEDAKSRFLSEIETSAPIIDSKDIKSADSITPKQLFFCPSVSQRISQLESLLHPERFTIVQNNLAGHNMRKGFTCIFYGAPGTGKTESVLQIARKTGRGIMIVDIPNLRSKWVGETEKNAKAIFDKYRNYCKQSTLAPILLFNEADAILCKRNEGAVGSVDKMENAMQNIILQEMENLEGIMIATTNLTNNLDKAFERRFLYKIEFTKPTPNESKHIWHAMLPEISETEAFELAKQYAFSGGQIENIARKQLVNAVLTGEDKVCMEAIKEACKTELFNNSETKRIGFC